MIPIPTVRALALALPEVEEQAHFERPSFRIRKKIFATLRTDEKKVVLKLSLIDQSVFSAYDQNIFYPVSGTWGKQGWTMVDMTKVTEGMFQDALTCAWRMVAPKALIKKHQLEEPADEL